MTKCECNLESVNHQPGECQGAAAVNALRHGTRLDLCPDCTLPDDTDRRETLQALTLLEQVKALAVELNVEQPPEYFDGLSETTLGYMLIGMMHINRERKGLDQ